MSIDMKQSSQVYKIIHTPTGKYYIGITWGRNMSYLRRFKKHIKGKGGVYIRELLLSGSSPQEFKVELVFEGELDRSIQLENDLSSLYPEGLNGNKGNAIITRHPEEMWKKRDETLSLLSDEEKEIINKKRSDSLRDTLSNLSESEMNHRMMNSCHNLTEDQRIRRGESISKGKKGKKTNQQEIMKQKYQSMTDDDFNMWCGGRNERYINRAKNLRNGTG